MIRVLAAFLLVGSVSLSDSAFALCSADLCQAEVDDHDLYHTASRLSVRLVNQSGWQVAFQRSPEDADPFAGSCSCQDQSENGAVSELQTVLQDLKGQYQHYLVDCRVFPAGGGSAIWQEQGRFNLNQTERTYAQWGQYFCGSSAYRFRAGNDLLESRFELVSALMNDADADGVTGDDACSNLPNNNFDWRPGLSGELLVDASAGVRRGCWADDLSFDNQVRGASVHERCDAKVVQLRNGVEHTLFAMSGVAPRLQMKEGGELARAAQTILDMQYKAHGEVRAVCHDGRIVGPFSSRVHGREYAEWQAAGACGSDQALGEVQFTPFAQSETVQLRCQIINDTDGDGVGNEVDACPLTPLSSAVYPDDHADSALRGCPVSCPSGHEWSGESCVRSCPVGSARDPLSGQCQCSDGLIFPAEAGNVCENKDEDRDGVPYPIDQCLDTPFPALVNSVGCEFDSDLDGVPDLRDHCPLTPPGAAVNAQGCGLDSDGDRVEDAREHQSAELNCAGTLAGQAVHMSPSAYAGQYLGCVVRAFDSDADGVPDSDDRCPSTPADELADASGCSFSQQDSDGDGVANALDLCPTAPGDASGCPSEASSQRASSCPVPSLAAEQNRLYQDILSQGQSASCVSKIQVKNAAGAVLGEVCRGSAGAYAYEQLEAPAAVLVHAESTDLVARAACLQRENPALAIQAQHESALFKLYEARLRRNLERASQHASCSAERAAYSSALSGRAAAAEKSGLESGDRLLLRGPVSGAAACGLLEAIPGSNQFIRQLP